MTAAPLVARFSKLGWLALAAIIGALYPIETSAEELVTFTSAPYRLGHLQERLARERGEASKAPESIEGYLSKPEGDGPFPAIVYLHGCGGLSEKTRQRMAHLLTGWGYVSLAVDSFSTRGIEEACNRLPDRQGDALGALSYLSKLPFVASRRIAVVGSSQGGIVTLQLGSTGSVPQARMFDIPEDLTFRAAVAYYPICSFASDELNLPTLILIGDRDDWSPASDCERLMKRRAGRGAPVDLIVYAGARHAFDVPALVDGRKFFGHWLKYDEDAATRSVQAMHDFLAVQLSQSP
jgi:dienelactone hydrolase